MIERCYNKKGKDYEKYGARGIRMSDSWRASFDTFILDMGDRPTPQHSIDRIDNDGNYCKENCRWATKEEQSRNRKVFKNNRSGTMGMDYNSDNKKWRARIYVNGKRIHGGEFKSLKDAISKRKLLELEYWS